MRLSYGERRAHLRNLIETHAPDMLKILPSDGGLHLCTRLMNGQDDVMLQERMITAQLDCRALSSYYHDKSERNRPDLPQGLVLGFAGWKKNMISQSFDELIDVIRRKP